MTHNQTKINKQSMSIKTTINQFVDLQKNDYDCDKLTTINPNHIRLFISISMEYNQGKRITPYSNYAKF